MPDDWRMVIFTTRKETQTTIETFLSERGIAVGTRIEQVHQATAIKRHLPPFEALRQRSSMMVDRGRLSTMLNLQAANVLVNYDLPWNPMIVEQRIGRAQRLQSKFANVCIYNTTLAGTFGAEDCRASDEEKLQLASHAIGDIEALLEASGLDDDEDQDGDGFSHRIRKLVLQSLKGIDVEVAAQLAAQSILDAEDAAGAGRGKHQRHVRRHECRELPGPKNAVTSSAPGADADGFVRLHTSGV